MTTLGKMGPEQTLAAESAAAIREALLAKQVHTDDPAFLIVQALEMSLRALEELPKSLDRAAEKRLFEIEAQVRAATNKVVAARVEALKMLTAEIRVAATKATANAAKAAYAQAATQVAAHGETRWMMGFMGGAAITLLSSSMAFQLGVYENGGGLPRAAGVLGRIATILSAPIGVAIIPLTVGALLAGLLSFSRK